MMARMNSQKNVSQPATLDTAVLVRRRWLLGAGAVAAGCGVTGVAWWLDQQARDQAPALSGLEAVLWPLVLETPVGAPLRMDGFRGKSLLLNFWATWCPPCVDEIPLLNRFYQENGAKGWQVLGLAVDKSGSVRNFLGHTPVDYPVAMAGPSGLDLSRSLGNLSGGLPFTLVVGAGGLVMQRKMGRLSSDDLTSWAVLK